MLKWSVVYVINKPMYVCVFVEFVQFVFSQYGNGLLSGRGDAAGHVNLISVAAASSW